ncbi:MAG: hypothetical protein J1E99_03495 [Muribaculaceae bacterium]|nr:hypothetical protein [Muribaculaceae bacterium]
MEFDESKAVDFINERLNGKKYPADELLNVIDMIWDYYESNGMLEIDAEDDYEEDIEEQLVDYVKNQLARDKEANVDVADVPAIVRAELDYEDSLLE